MVTSSKRAYAVPRSLHPEPLLLQQSAADPDLRGRCSNMFCLSLSVGSLGPGAHTVCLSLLSFSCGYEVWFHPSYCLAGAPPLSLDVGYLLKVAPAPHSRRSSGFLGSSAGKKSYSYKLHFVRTRQEQAFVPDVLCLACTFMSVLETWKQNYIMIDYATFKKE